MHAKTDSEDTSLAPSSPARQSQLYYVQSPSRDSHDDGDNKTTNIASFYSSPVLISPSESPFPHTTVVHHSRDSSSSTRFSASLKPCDNGSCKISHNDGSDVKGRNPWKQCDVIEEERLPEDYDSSNGGVSRRFYFFAFLVSFFLLFSLFSLILWSVSKSQKPNVAMKSIKFESYTVQAGSDSSGVATDMITLNSTVTFIFRNTATFFGIHVTSTPIDLSFNQFTIASGSIKQFYQSRKSERSVVVSVMGNKIPLYGSGTSFIPSLGTSTVSPSVAMNLSSVILSRAYVLGKLVNPKFYSKIQCSISFDPEKPSVLIHLKNSCTYN